MKTIGCSEFVFVCIDITYYNTKLKPLSTACFANFYFKKSIDKGNTNVVQLNYKSKEKQTCYTPLLYNYTTDKEVYK